MPFGALGCNSGGDGSANRRKAAAATQAETAAAISGVADAAETELDEERIAECVQTFNTFDYDSDGRISMKELGNIMRCLGYEMSRAELKKIFGSVDKNRNGYIDLQEFLDIVNRKQATERLATDRQLAQAFRVFDADRDGFISRAELRATLRRLMRPADVTDELVDDMIRGADDDRDDRVSFAEFVAIVTMR